MLTAKRLQRRLNTQLVLERMPMPAWLGAGAYACMRLVSPAWAPWAALLATLAGAVWVARHVRRQGWTEAQAAVRLDRLAGAGGLLLTVREVPHPIWASRVDDRVVSAKAPPLRYRRPLAFTAAAALFALASGLVPARPTTARAPQQAAASMVEKLEEQAQALADERALPAALEEELARLRDEVDASRFDATDWESADTLQEAFDDAAQRRADALSRAEAAAAQLRDAIEAKAADEQLAREREQLEQALTELGESGGGGETNAPNGQRPPEAQQGAGEQGQQPGQGGQQQRSASDVEQLRQALQQRREQLSKRFGQGQSPSGQQQSSGQSSQQPGQGQGRSQQQGSQQGRGEQQEGNSGIGRDGPSDTPLRFGDEAATQPDRLEFAPLPQGEGQDDSGIIWGLSPRAPEERHVPTAAPSGRHTGDDAAGLRDGPVPPRHRDTIRRFFDRPAAPR